MHSFEWPAAMLRRVHPRRDLPLPRKPRKVSARAAYRALHKAWPAHVTALAEFLPAPLGDQLHSMDDELRGEISGEIPGPSDPQRQAAAFLGLRLRFNSQYHEKRDPVSRHLVDHWVQGAGLRFAVEALLAALEVEEETAKNLEKPWGLSVGHGVGVARWGVGGFDRLREYLAAADDDDHAAALEIAAARWDTASAGHRAILSYLFPERGEWLDACLDASTGVDHHERFFFFSVKTAQLERVDGGRLVAYYTDDSKLADVLPTLAYAAGLDGAPILGQWLEDYLETPWRTAPGVRELAEVVALLPDEQALASLLRGLEDKQPRTALQAAVERFPRRMLGLLAPELGSRGERGKRAEILIKIALAQESGSQSGEIRRPEILDALDADTRTRLEAMQESLEASAQNEAAADDLPSVLREPPWQRRLETSDPLFVRPKELPELPAFADPSALPRPALPDGRALPPDAVRALLLMLAFTSPSDPYAGLAEVREALDAPSLADFVEALFDAWLAAGADAKQKWAFLALGHFGGDRAARRLEPLLRAWPKQSAHARAVIGLEVLAMIGTDLALMLLQGLAEKASKGLERAAENAIERIAVERGLSPEELADRLVPALGLSAGGSLELDYGPRRFTVGFDQELKPFVIDAAGRQRKTAPKPGARDDETTAGEAYARFKELKKNARTVASTQITRLERALCDGRRWRARDFERFLAGHPLLVHLVRRLLWGVYREDDRLEAAFRVDRDGSFADLRDEPFDLPATRDSGRDNAIVGLVHPVDLDAESLRAWRVIWGDYELISPFSQLDRDIFRPSEDERNALELHRFEGREVPATRVLGLERRGWRKGEILDGGVYSWMVRPAGDGAHEIVLDFEPGLAIGDPTAFGPPVLQTVLISKIGTQQERPALAFGELAPRLFSELIRDLEELVRPG